MSITANTIARTHRAGHAAMLAGGHRTAWQVTKPSSVEMFEFKPNFGAFNAHVTTMKGNRAWGPPSA